MTLREYPVASVHPDSHMTEEYRSTLLRKLVDQARAELVAAHMYSRWVQRTPDPEEKLHLAALAREETDHWFRAVKLMEELGVPADQVADYQTHDVFISIVRVLAGPIRWVDLLMMSFLIDHAAYFLVQDFAESSYAPWAEMSKGILIEEERHSDFGAHFIEAQVEKLGRVRVQRALRKWWPACASLSTGLIKSRPISATDETRNGPSLLLNRPFRRENDDHFFQAVCAVRSRGVDPLSAWESARGLRSR